jgi:DNA-binding transcriptional regulator YiaG
MKSPKRNIAQEIISDLQEIHATIKAGVPLRPKYTVRTVRTIPDPGNYNASGVPKTRELLGASQPVFARMLGASTALVPVVRMRPAQARPHRPATSRSDPRQSRGLAESCRSGVVAVRHRPRRGGHVRANWLCPRTSPTTVTLPTNLKTAINARCDL